MGKIYLYHFYFLLGQEFQPKIGGTSVYQFLNMQPNARIAALGGSAIATPDNDMNLVLPKSFIAHENMKKPGGHELRKIFCDMAWVLRYAWNTMLGPMAAGIQ